MSYHIELHPKAILELEDAYNWYEERLVGLGDNFLTSVNSTLREICINPETYAKKKGFYREAGVDTFPYLVIYEILKKEHIVFVTYIFHTKRNPRLKFKR